MLQKRFFIISIILHIACLLVLDLITHESCIKKTFVAYGRHSRVPTRAYFRRMAASKFNYHKYYPKRRKKVRAKKRTKKVAAKKKVMPKKRKVVSKLQKKSKKVVAPPKKPEPPKKIAKKVAAPPKKPPEPVQEEEEVLHFNLMGESDPRVIEYQQCIQKEVDRLWRPPLGVPKGSECIATFHIDSNGQVKSFKIDKKSKILIYDLSVIRIAKQFKFEKMLWGKSFTINFLQ